MAPKRPGSKAGAKSSQKKLEKQPTWKELREAEAAQAAEEERAALALAAATAAAKGPPLLHHRKALWESGVKLRADALLECLQADKVDLNLVRHLLSQSTPNKNMKDKVFGWCPVHFAAHKGHAKLLELLLKGKANPNAKDQRDNQMLHLAARAGHEACLGYLLAHSCEVDAKNKDGWTPLTLAAMNGHTGVTESLLSAEAFVDVADREGRTPSMWAARGGHFEIIRALLGKGFDLDVRDKESLTVADHAQEYLEVRRALRQATETNGSLLAAAQRGDAEGAKQALLRGAYVNVRDELGWTPLTWSAMHHSLGLVQLLAQNLADPAAVEASADVIQDLSLGKQEERAELNRVLRRCFDCKDRMLIAAKSNDWEGVQAELAIGGVVSTREEGTLITCLMCAAIHCEFAAVETLIETHKAPVDQRDAQGWTAAHFSTQTGDQELVSAMWHYGIDFCEKTYDGSTSQHLAAQGDDGGMILLLAEAKASVDAETAAGTTPLHVAVQWGCTRALSVLLALGADTSVRDIRGRSLLTAAVVCGHCSVVRALLGPRQPPDELEGDVWSPPEPPEPPASAEEGAQLQEGEADPGLGSTLRLPQEDVPASASSVAESPALSATSSPRRQLSPAAAARRRATVEAEEKAEKEQSDGGPMEPGVYKVVRNRIGIEPLPIPGAGESIGQLRKGDVVDIVEVQAPKGKRRLRGRLKDPPEGHENGWITMMNTEKGDKFVEKAIRTDVETLLRRASEMRWNLGVEQGWDEGPLPPALFAEDAFVGGTGEWPPEPEEQEEGEPSAELAATAPPSLLEAPPAAAASLSATAPPSLLKPAAMAAQTSSRLSRLSPKAGLAPAPAEAQPTSPSQQSAGYPSSPLKRLKDAADVVVATSSLSVKAAGRRARAPAPTAADQAEQANTAAEVAEEGAEPCEEAGEPSEEEEEEEEEEPDDESLDTPLVAAMRAGHRDVFDLLLEFKAPPNLEDYKGRTPIMMAVARGSMELVESLLSAKANPDVVDRKGNSLVSMAKTEAMHERLRWAVMAATGVEPFSPPADAADEGAPGAQPADEEAAADEEEEEPRGREVWRLRLEGLSPLLEPWTLEAHIWATLQALGEPPERRGKRAQLDRRRRAKRVVMPDRVQVILHEITARPLGHAYLDFDQQEESLAVEQFGVLQVAGRRARIIDEGRRLLPVEDDEDELEEDDEEEEAAKGFAATAPARPARTSSTNQAGLTTTAPAKVLQQA